MMPAAVGAQEAAAGGAGVQSAAASAADSAAADDPALEALLQAPAAEPMDVDAALADTGPGPLADAGGGKQSGGAAAAMTPG